MENIHRAIGYSLKWVQPRGTRREFRLKSDQGDYASLTWAKSFGSLAEAAAADGRWSFKRTGFLHPRVTVRQPGEDEDVAVYAANWSGDGVLEFKSGRRYSWAGKNFWRTEWAFRNTDGEVVSFRTKAGLLRFNLELKVLRDTPEISVLAPLGLYLLVLMRDDTAANTVATSAALHPF